jgi:hypothetical protein
MDGVRKTDVAHRHPRQFVLLEAQPWYQEHLRRLCLLWGKWNHDYFGCALVKTFFSMATGVLNYPRLDSRLVSGDLHTVPVGCGAGGQPEVAMDILPFEAEPHQRGLTCANRPHSGKEVCHG